MSKTLTSEQVEFIIERVLDNAAHTKQLREENEEYREFYDGAMSAYHAILDSMKNQLIIDEQDLKEFGLDINLEKELV